MLILIVDDHPLFRQAVRHIIKDVYPSATVREAATGAQGLEYVLAEPISLALVDIALPDQNGLDLLKRLKQLRPTLPCLVLSMHDEPRYAELSLQFGASGYLTKDVDGDEVRQALRTVMAGGRYTNASLAQRLADRGSAGRAASSMPRLSARELEVLAHFAQGLTVSQAAAHMKLSVKTVSTYRIRLLEKLRLKTTAALIRYAVDRRIVP